LYYNFPTFTFLYVTFLQASFFFRQEKLEPKPKPCHLPAACFFVLLFVKPSAFWRGFEGKIQGFAPIPLALMNKSAV
jgi:hypothetical protein